MSQNLSEKALLSLLDCLGDMHSTEKITIACQVLALAKLSQNNAIPENLSLSNSNFPSTSQQLNERFNQLSHTESLGNNQNAFRDSRISDFGNDILGMMKIALQISDNHTVECLDVSNFIAENLSGKLLPGDGGGVPIEITNLMLHLAGDIRNKRIYFPHDDLSQYASTAYKMGAISSIETRSHNVFPYLVNILKESDVDIAISDPILQPSFQEKGKLKKFDFSMAFPPIHQKYDTALHKLDWFNRFPEVTSSGNILHIRHMIAQTTEKAILAVSNSVLFSSGAEYSLRQDLLNKGQIETVISLPSALLFSTPIPFSIIVINVRGGLQEVSFVNGNDERFFSKNGKGRSRLINWKLLLDTFYEGKDESCIVKVSVKKILENNSYLEVSAYTLPPEKKEINKILNDSETFQLSDLVKFIRPPAKCRSTDMLGANEGIEALEVVIGDFPEYGYVQNPTRTVVFEKDNKTGNDYYLKPRDILIAIKASTGKVAIVSEAAALDEGKPWIVNQSCLVLRVGKKIDPKVLFMYLSSEMGQYLLRSVSSGASIPLIQLARLKELSVVLPSAEEAANIIRDFDRMVELQSQVAEIMEKQQSLSRSYWSL
jgi:type I restriction enzyme M protein